MTLLTGAATLLYLGIGFIQCFAIIDGIAIYYASKLPALKTKSQSELNGIQKNKLAFPGSVIIK